MSRLRIYLLAILAWAFVFYNTERLIAPINIASFMYGLAALYSIIIIFYAPVYRLKPWSVFLISLVPYVGLKTYFSSPIGGMNIPLTVTEVVSLGITEFLSWQIGYGLETLRNEILKLTIGSANLAASPFQSAQAEFYREVRRARHYSRPVSVLSISPSKESIELSINRFLQEAQNNIIRQYIIARTADLLRSTLKETDVISMRNNHFLILLPETEQKHLPIVTKRLQHMAQEKLGLSLKIGASTFPEDALTFESLVETAEERMKQHPSVATNGKEPQWIDENAEEEIPGEALDQAGELNKADVAN